MKKLVLFLLLLHSLISFSQQAVPASGGTVNGALGSFSITLGQAASGYFQNNSNSMTLGVQQTYASYTTQIQPAQCNTVLAHLDTAILADTIVGAQKYRFEVSNGADIRTIESDSNSFTLVELDGGACFNTVYAIRVLVQYAGIWYDYGTSCNLTTPDVAPKAAAQTFCGASTVANLIALGTDVKWYTTATGGLALATATALTSGTYYVSQTLYSCESTRTAVDVTITPQVTPTFTGVAAVCSGSVIDALPAISLNGYTGTWSPALNNLATTEYTFTPAEEQCATNATQIIEVITISAPVAAAQTFCGDSTVSNLVATGETIKWYASANDAADLSSATALASGIYYVSQTIASCESARTAVGVTITPQVTPTFTEVAAVCSGSVIDDLPTVSLNGYTGTWSPALNNLATTEYTFTPAEGQCATTVAQTIVVITTIPAPTAAAQTFCGASTVADLLATGENIKWYATANEGAALESATALATGIYYVSQTIASCESARTAVGVTITPQVTPTFMEVAAVCSGSVIEALPAISLNGYIGTWSPALNNVATTEYSFTPVEGQCAITATQTIEVIIMSAPIAAAQTFCIASSVANLEPTGENSKWYATANEGVALESATALTSGIYYVSQTIDSCESARTEVAVTITPQVTPTFTEVAAVCSGSVIDALPTISLNGYTGTWSPALNNLASTEYTFTPIEGQCAITAAQTIEIITTIPAPTAAAQTFCEASTIANLVATGTDIKWYAAANEVSALAPSTALATGTYYSSQILNGCESPRSEVAVSVNDAEITASATTVCAGTAATLIVTTQNANSSIIDTFSMNMFQSFNHTTPLLESNENYLLKAYGTVGFAGNIDSQDAAYQYNWFGSTLTPYPFPDSTHLWWYINGSNQYRPNNDVYSSDHIYYFSFNGNGAPLQVSWTDDSYGDNSGQLNFELIKVDTATYTWSTGETSATINPTPSETTTFWCDVTVNGLTCRKEMTIEVTPNVTYYADNDGDGFGNPAVSQQSCIGELTGYVTNNTDCNDNNNATTEILISNQPLNVTICKAIGASATISVVVEGATSAYQWYSQAASATTWTALTNTANYSGATTATLNITKTATTVPATGTKYKVVMTSFCGNVTSAIASITDVTVLSKAATITAKSATNGVLSPLLTSCQGNSVNLSLASGSIGNIQWQSSTDGISFDNVGQSIAQSALSASNAAMPFNTGVLNQTTWFRVVASNGVCSSVNGTALKITVSSPANAGTINGGDVTVCAPLATGFDANGNALTAAITNSTTLSLSDHTAGATVLWQKSTNFNTASPSWSAAGSTASSIVATNLAADTWYRALVANGACSVTTAVTKISVNKAAKAGTIISAASVCTGTDITFTSGAYTGTAIQWEVATTSAAAGFAAVEGATGASFAMTNVGYTPLSKFYVRSVVTSGDCTLARSAVKTIVVNPLSVAGTIKGGGILCSNGGSTVSVSGNIGTIQWQYSTDGITFSDAPYWKTISGVATYFNPNGTTEFTTPSTTTGIGAAYVFTSFNTSGTVYFRARIKSGACSETYTSSVQYGNGSLAVAGTISAADAIICPSTGTTLTLTGAVGAVQWQKAAISATTGLPGVFASMTGQTGTTLSTGNLTASTAYQALVTIGYCSTLTAAYVSVVVVSKPSTKNITSNVTSPTGATALLAICTTSSFSKVLTIGAGSNGAIQWQKSTTSTTTGFTDIEAANGGSYTIANPAVGVNYFRAKFTNSCGLAVYSATFTVYYKNCAVLAKMTEAKVVPAVAVVPFDVMAYPNPFSTTFNLEIITRSSENVAVNVYDALGKLVETRNVSVSEVGSQEVGTNYPTGTYTIMVVQGENVKTLRVIKR